MPRQRALEATDKQLELYAWIVEYVEANGFQPSQAEMAAHFGVHTNAVRGRLKGLESLGHIDLSDQRDRALRLRGVRFLAVAEDLFDKVKAAQKDILAREEAGHSVNGGDGHRG